MYQEGTIFTTTECTGTSRIYHVEINVPSGHLVFGNNPRDTFRAYGNREVNRFIERLRTSRDYEELNIAHFSVLNTCPSVSKIDNTNLIVGQQDGPSEGTIITDLWWYFAVDKDYFDLKGGDYKNTFIVDVSPGRYRFTHCFEENEIEGKDGPFTTIQRIGSPLPLEDPYKELDSIQKGPEHILYSLKQRLPLLFKNPQRAISQIFLALGSGADWHPNGFPVFHPEDLKNERTLSIPSLEKKYAWYPQFTKSCNLYKIAHGQIYANPEFKKLAIDLATCIVEHGVKLPSGYDEAKYIGEIRECLDLLRGKCI